MVSIVIPGEMKGQAKMDTRESQVSTAMKNKCSSQSKKPMARHCSASFMYSKKFNPYNCFMR